MQTTLYPLFVPIPEPMRISVVADLHNGDGREVLPELERFAPDCIAIPGDLLEREPAPETLAFLAKAAKIAPVFYAPGNHERLDDDQRKAIAKTGAVLLENGFTAFRSIWVGGLLSGFGNKRQGNLKRTPPPDTRFLDRFADLNGFKLLLCHHPEYYPEFIRPREIHLTLSGHAHGGQWQIRGQGIFAPGQGLFPKYTVGVHENRLVVSRGLGNHTLIPRFGNPIELVNLELMPQ